MILWKCAKCGFSGRNEGILLDEKDFPIICACHHKETYEEAINRGLREFKHGSLKEATNHRCQYLGGVKESFNGKWLACGCSRIYLYPCAHHNELVTLHQIRPPNKIDTAEDVKNAVHDFHPDYHGKTCQGCRYFEVKDENKIKTKSIKIILKPPYEEIKTRNIIFHCCPLKKNDTWLWHFDELKKRITQFNGKRIMSVATGNNLHDINTVKQQLEKRGLDFEVIEVENDIRLREVASFKELLNSIKSTNPNEATFYAHTKGNSVKDKHDGIFIWTNAMYTNLLDRTEDVNNGLIYYPSVGCCKIHWPTNERPPYPTRLDIGDWMFAGTFFWFRNDIIFSQKSWNEIADDRYAAEAWLSSLLNVEHGLSLYQPWLEDIYPTPSPYKKETYEHTI